MKTLNTGIEKANKKMEENNRELEAAKIEEQKNHYEKQMSQ